MAVLYKPTKFDTPVDPVSLTEQEHADSCDINKMIQAVHRGYAVRGSNGAQGLNYPDGMYDDTTMDALQFRILKQDLEQELGEIAETQEFEESIFNKIPTKIRERFNFKIKKVQQTHDETKPKQNDEKLDLKTKPKSEEPDPLNQLPKKS